jgi:hypothetical protein
MRLGNRWIIGSLTLLCLAGLTGRATAQQHALHHLHHSLWELKDARFELAESRWQFGEHKLKAERAMNETINQIELILRHAGDYSRGTPTRGDLREEYRRYPHHPHLHHALNELRHAHKELSELRHDFGGHKQAAMREIDIAITQIDILLRNARR